MASLLSAAFGVPDLAEAAPRREPQTDAASAICRMFEPESVYDASFDGGALAAALTDAAVDVTVYPEPSSGPFGMATAMSVPADSKECAALAHELAASTDIVLITLDWRGPNAPARIAAAWLSAFADAGLHFDPLVWDESAFPGGMLFRRDAPSLTSRVARAFARVIAERHGANCERSELAQIRDVHARVTARAAQLETENRLLRSRLDSLEVDRRAMTNALRNVNVLFADELEAVRAAEETVADDIVALRESGLWKLKLKLAGARKNRPPT